MSGPRGGGGPRALLGVVGCLLAATGWPASAAARDMPARSLATLAEEYAAAEKDLLRRCTIDGHEKLAAIIAAWKLPPAEGRQVAFMIPAAIDTPPCVDGDSARSIWNDFLAARRARAAGTF